LRSFGDYVDAVVDNIDAVVVVVVVDVAVAVVVVVFDDKDGTWIRK